MSGTIQPSIPPEAVPQTRSDTRVADARGVYASQAADRGASAGYKNSEIGTIPVDWDLHPLGSLYRFSNGVNADKEAYGQGTPFINVLEVITNSHLQERHIPGKVLLGKTAREAFAVLPGDVLFNRTSETQEEVGLSAVYCGHAPVVFGGFVIRGRAVSNLMDATYAGYGLRALSVRRQIVAQGQGAIRSNIGQASLRRVQVSLPTLDEQRAIAEALSDVDGLLGALDALIAKKRAIKQAAMQQLLTGKTRLAGFSGAWGASCIGAEFHVQLGKMLDAAKNSGELKPYLGNRSVQWGRIDLSELAEARLTDTDVNRLRLRKGDLLVCEGGEVGRAAIWNDELSECYYQKALHRLRPRGSFDPYLMQLLLEFWASTGGFDAFVTKTSIAHLPKDKLEIIPLPVPPVEEQSAIVSVLAEFESEIAALERRRDKTRAIKQGTMQQLLTGRVRLVPPSSATTGVSSA